MTGDPATPPPASDFGPGHGPFLPADSLNAELLWTLHTPDSWARAITTRLLREAQASESFETEAIVGMTRYGGRLRVGLRFRRGGGEFGEGFKLTI
jgi:hypothetical protein